MTATLYGCDVQNNDITEDYVLVIDADMIMRQPFYPEVMGVGPGAAVSAYFG